MSHRHIPNKRFTERQLGKDAVKLRLRKASLSELHDELYRARTRVMNFQHLIKPGQTLFQEGVVEGLEEMIQAKTEKGNERS